jgi:hypothetical protein
MVVNLFVCCTPLFKELFHSNRFCEHDIFIYVCEELDTTEKHTQKKSVNSLNDGLKQLAVNIAYDDFGCSGSRAGEEISPTNVASASSSVRSRDEPRNRVDNSSSLILSRTFAPLTYSLQRHLMLARNLVSHSKVRTKIEGA